MLQLKEDKDQSNLPQRDQSLMELVLYYFLALTLLDLMSRQHGAIPPESDSATTERESGWKDDFSPVSLWPFHQRINSVWSPSVIVCMKHVEWSRDTSYLFLFLYLKHVCLIFLSSSVMEVVQPMRERKNLPWANVWNVTYVTGIKMPVESTFVNDRLLEQIKKMQIRNKPTTCIVRFSH